MPQYCRRPGGGDAPDPVTRNAGSNSLESRIVRRNGEPSARQPRNPPRPWSSNTRAGRLESFRGRSHCPPTMVFVMRNAGSATRMSAPAPRRAVGGLHQHGAPLESCWAVIAGSMNAATAGNNSHHRNDDHQLQEGESPRCRAALTRPLAPASVLHQQLVRAVQRRAGVVWSVT